MFEQQKISELRWKFLLDPWKDSIGQILLSLIKFLMNFEHEKIFKL